MDTEILLDEQISDYKKYLEALNWKVKTVEDVKMKGVPDIEIVKYAKQNGLLFISKNQDAIQISQTLDVPSLWVSSAFIVKAIDAYLKRQKTSTD